MKTEMTKAVIANQKHEKNLTNILGNAIYFLIIGFAPSLVLFLVAAQIIGWLYNLKMFSSDTFETLTELNKFIWFLAATVISWIVAVIRADRNMLAEKLSKY